MFRSETKHLDEIKQESFEASATQRLLRTVDYAIKRKHTAAKNTKLAFGAFMSQRGIKDNAYEISKANEKNFLIKFVRYLPKLRFKGCSRGFCVMPRWSISSSQ